MASDWYVGANHAQARRFGHGVSRRIAGGLDVAPEGLLPLHGILQLPVGMLGHAALGVMAHPAGAQVLDAREDARRRKRAPEGEGLLDAVRVEGARNGR